MDIHRRCLVTSAQICNYYGKNHIPALRVIRALNRAGARFLLAGVHSRMGWMDEARSAGNVEFLVPQTRLKETAETLGDAFPKLERQRKDGKVCFVAEGRFPFAIHLMTCDQWRVFWRLRHVIPGKNDGFAIPNVALSIVLAHQRMTDDNYPHEVQLQDAHDFLLMLTMHPELDAAPLRETGKLVNSRGVSDMLRRVDLYRTTGKFKLWQG